MVPAICKVWSKNVGAEGFLELGPRKLEGGEKRQNEGVFLGPAAGSWTFWEAGRVERWSSKARWQDRRLEHSVLHHLPFLVSWELPLKEYCPALARGAVKWEWPWNCLPCQGGNQSWARSKWHRTSETHAKFISDPQPQPRLPEPECILLILSAISAKAPVSSSPSHNQLTEIFHKPKGNTVCILRVGEQVRLCVLERGRWGFESIPWLFLTTIL